MFLGSNNSLTYLKPYNSWFGRFGRCQSIDYEIQYMVYGVRLFDFKLYIDKNNHIILKNGEFKYPIFSFYEILDYLDKKGDVVVLITLDSEIENKKIEDKFIESCNIIESIYENLRLCGGYRNFDKKVIYKFKWEEKHGMPITVTPSNWSRLYRYISIFCPNLIRSLNRKYIEKYKNQPIYLILNHVNKN